MTATYAWFALGYLTGLSLGLAFSWWRFKVEAKRFRTEIEREGIEFKKNLAQLRDWYVERAKESSGIADEPPNFH